jgi:hypothetical protein
MRVNNNLYTPVKRKISGQNQKSGELPLDLIRDKRHDGCGKVSPF